MLTLLPRSIGLNRNIARHPCYLQPHLPHPRDSFHSSDIYATSGFGEWWFVGHCWCTECAARPAQHSALQANNTGGVGGVTSDSKDALTQKQLRDQDIVGSLMRELVDDLASNREKEQSRPAPAFARASAHEFCHQRPIGHRGEETWADERAVERRAGPLARTASA